ncbi:MAG TPA: MATE family efflux transporter [Burkholderiaceae bacterium]
MNPITAFPAPPPTPPLWRLSWPLFVELTLGVAAGVLGTVLAARMSDAAAGAFSLANNVSASLFVLFRIVGAGIGVVVAQRLGAGSRGAADALARASLGASTWLGGAAALCAAVGALPLLKAMNAPSHVLPLAWPFLAALAPAMVLDAWNASMASVMRSHLRTRDTLAVMTVSQACHLALALPLMPLLGLPGYALALLASRCVALALHQWLWRTRLAIHPRLHDWWRVPSAELAAMLHIGLPGAAENIAYRVGFTISMAAVARLGAMELATHAYVTQIGLAALMFGLTAGLSVEIVVGQLIGAGRPREAHALVQRTLARGLTVSVAVTALAALFGPRLLQLFTAEPSIVSLGSMLLWWTVLLEPGRTFNLVVINALRAAGDARFPVLAGITSMVVVLAGGSWWLGVHMGWGLVGVWIAYAADEWIRGLAMWARWRRHAWVPHARAVRRRSRMRRASASAAA